MIPVHCSDLVTWNFCIYIRDSIDDKPCPDDVVELLEQNENYMHTSASLHCGELEALITVYGLIKSCEFLNEKQNITTDYEKLYKHFLDSKFHNKALLSKFVTVANHLHSFPAAFSVLNNHFDTGKNLDDWKLARIRPAGIWKSPVVDIVNILKLVCTATLTSAAAVVQYMAETRFRSGILVSSHLPVFPLFLFFISFCSFRFLLLVVRSLL